MMVFFDAIRAVTFVTNLVSITSEKTGNPFCKHLPEAGWQRQKESHRLQCRHTALRDYRDSKFLNSLCF